MRVVLLMAMDVLVPAVRVRGLHVAFGDMSLRRQRSLRRHVLAAAVRVRGLHVAFGDMSLRR
ncbi:MAG: hypothetical protein WCH44_16835, partial [Betaproteobacteria bacterium]